MVPLVRRSGPRTVRRQPRGISSRNDKRLITVAIATPLDAAPVTSLRALDGDSPEGLAAAARGNPSLLRVQGTAAGTGEQLKAAGLTREELGRVAVTTASARVLGPRVRLRRGPLDGDRRDRRERPRPVLLTALASRFGSRGLDHFADQTLSAMRKQLGGHAKRPAG